MGVRRDINPVYIWLSIFFSSPVDSPLLGAGGGGGNIPKPEALNLRHPHISKPL